MQLGIDDASFIRGKVPMTKQEIRILVLVKAAIPPNGIVFDIGAGTGSLSVEAARLAPEGHVYALERKEEACGLIRQNAVKFDVTNLTVVPVEAPEGIDGLPDCDAVLIGGSGGHLTSILDAVTPKLRLDGHIVVTCITVQTLHRAISYFRQSAEYTYDACSVQVSRLRPVGPYDMMQAENPVFIITAKKER